MDSLGMVVGLVGVDFDASQITKQSNFSITLIVVSTVLLVALCILFFLLYSAKMRKIYQELGSDITDLSNNLKTLFDEIDDIQSTSVGSTDEQGEEAANFVEYVHTKTLDMAKRLRDHDRYINSKPRSIL